jgi:hypothetical protein
MNHRRVVGMDLGIATAHTMRVLDGEGTIVAKRKAWPTVDSLIAVETAALAGCPADTRLEVVIEPTGPTWLPPRAGTRRWPFRRKLRSRGDPLRRVAVIPTEVPVALFDGASVGGAGGEVA